MGSPGRALICLGIQMKRAWLLIVTAFLLGACSFGIQYSAARPVQLDNAVSEFSAVLASFEVLETPVEYSRQNSLRVGIKLLSANLSDQEIGFAARGELSGGNEISGLVPKSQYRCLLELRPTKPGERAGFSARCKSELQQIRTPPAANGIITAVRNAFLINTRGTSPDAKGLVAGLAIGDTSQISSKLQLDMKAVSLTHLTAVSGANCAIVLAMAYLFVRRLGGNRWLRLVVGLATLLFYVLLVGAQPSVLRAAVMAAAILVGISIGRKSAPLNALGLAVLVLLVADPWLAVDFGFALSVAATAGLLILTEPIAAKLSRRLPRWLAVSIAVALAAQIFCLPILLQLQSGLSTYSLPANVLSESLVAPITVLGILAVIFSIPAPWVAQLLSFTGSLASQLIVWIASHFAGLPFESLSWPTGLVGAIAAAAVIFGFVLWLKTEPTSLRNLGITALALIASVSVGSIAFTQVRAAAWPMRDWSVVACDVGQGDAVLVRSQGLIALIDVGKDDKPIDDCLTRLSIRKIDLLVLTHFDMDHVGGIRGALEGRDLSVVLVSPFKDERWGATGTNEYLAHTGAKIILAESGLSGSIGEFGWQVLSPIRGAEGAEDSNDASVVMLWSGRFFNLLTMADLGERGQMRMTSGKSWWQNPSIHSLPLLLKVSHHGSADQYPELIESLRPDIGLISVGKNNSYGHPTLRTLGLLERSGAIVARTDEQGSIAVRADAGGLVIATSPHS